MAKNLNLFNVLEVCPLAFSDGQNNLPGLDLDLKILLCSHIQCKEPRNINHIFYDIVYTFYTTFFELQRQSTEPDCWASGQLHSFNDVGGKSYGKACVTVRHYHLITNSFKTFECPIKICHLLNIDRFKTVAPRGAAHSPSGLLLSTFVRKQSTHTKSRPRFAQMKSNIKWPRNRV